MEYGGVPTRPPWSGGGWLNFGQNFSDLTLFNKISSIELLLTAIGNGHGSGSVKLDLHWKWLPLMVVIDHRRWVDFLDFTNTHTASFDFSQLTTVHGIFQRHLTTSGVGFHGGGQPNHLCQFLWLVTWPIIRGRGSRSRVSRVWKRVIQSRHFRFQKRRTTATYGARIVEGGFRDLPSRPLWSKNAPIEGEAKSNFRVK